MYKVFINSKCIILTSKLPSSSKKRVLPLAETPLSKILKIVRLTSIKKLYLYDQDPERLLQLFKAKIPIVQAGGGIVKNQNHKFLFIHRKGKWDLPKGKIDKGETPKACAKREVEEETGVKKLEVKQLAGMTYHIFKQNNTFQLKETFWFHMRTNYSGKLKPQQNEDITKAVWKSDSKAFKALKNSYPNIIYLFKKISQNHIRTWLGTKEV